MDKRITLMGSKIAKTGNEFIYCGVLEECSECRFKKICHDGLMVGKRYRIVSVRSAKHPCIVYGEGVKVIEVEYSNKFTILIESKKALEGLTLSHSDIQCNNILCKFYNLCHPEGIPEKYKIMELHEKIKCPKGNSLIKATVSPI